MQDLLLGSEITEELQASTEAETTRQIKSFQSRAAKAAKLTNTVTAQPPTAAELNGLRVFIDGSVVRTPHLDAWAARHQAVIADSPRQAAVCIAAHPWEPLEDNVTLNSVLNGAWVVGPGVYTLDAIGPAVKYKPALSVRRQIWASDRFKLQHSHYWQELLETIAVSGNCCWKLLEDDGEWAAAKARAMGGGRSAEVLALVVEDEVSGSVNHTLTLPDFMKFITVVDNARTSLGLGSH